MHAAEGTRDPEFLSIAVRIGIENRTIYSSRARNLKEDSYIASILHLKRKQENVALALPFKLDLLTPHCMRR